MSDSWTDLAVSPFFKSEEVKEEPIVKTIKDIYKKEVSFKDKPPEMVTLISFEDTDPQMIANTEVL